MRPDTALARSALKHETLTFLDALRTAFPLEQRIVRADEMTRTAYARVLTCWIEGRIPSIDFLSAEQLHSLSALDAIVPGPEGIGCYPFSTNDRDIAVRLGRRRVTAMCAIDALAIARLARSASVVDARCTMCLGPVSCDVQADGSLLHDAGAGMRVLWRHAESNAGSCSDGLCRNLVFLCRQCAAPADGDCLTLPQATAVANAFFGFQRGLILSGSARGYP